MKTRGALGLLFLLLSLAVAPSIAREKAFDAESLHAIAPKSKDHSPVDAGKGSSLTGSKSSVGTKDAPVDGLDGKPHAGPFVEASPDESRRQAASDSLASSHDDSQEHVSSSSTSDKSGESSTGLHGSSADDEEGATSDKSDRSSATRNTGTEGGISEKDRDRKAQEGLGVGKGRTPDSPKEPIDLPDSIEDRIDLKEKTEKTTSSQKQSSDKEKSWDAVGLEVSATKVFWLGI